MKKLFINILTLTFVLFYFSELSAQWDLKRNTEDGKYSLVTNSSSFFGISAGNVYSETVIVLNPGDTSMWRLVRNNDNGLYSLAENKTSFMGIDSGRIKTKAVYILNPSTLSSLGLDTTKLAYLNKQNTFSENIILTPPSLTGSASSSAINISQTWNTTGSPTAFKLNVTETASGSSSLLMDLQNTGSSMFNVSKTGVVRLGGTLYLGQTATPGATGGSSIFQMNLRMLNIAFYNNAETSGTLNSIGAAPLILPTSGNAVFNSFSLSPVINQTGGANGVTRGLYVNPTLTSAADWRAIETVNGSLVMSDSYLAGSGSLAGSLVNLNQTWNTTGTPTALKMNVTNTASNVNSLLMDLQVNGASQFSVRKDGFVSTTNSISSGNTVTGSNFVASTFGFRAASTGAIFWNGRTMMQSGSDGTMSITNNAGTIGAEVTAGNLLPMLMNTSSLGSTSLYYKTLFVKSTSISDTIITASTTLGTTFPEKILVDASSGNVTLTLPNDAALRRYNFRIKRVDNSGNTVTISTAGTIDDASNKTLSYNAVYNISCTASGVYKIF